MRLDQAGMSQGDVPKKAPEDQEFISELHQRGKHAQEQAGYHAAQLRMWERITESCERALNTLEEVSTEYNEADAPMPSRFH